VKDDSGQQPWSGPARPETIEVGVRRLRDEASALIERVRRGDRLLVTRRRRPVAIVLSIDEAGDFLLAYGEDFVAARMEARTELIE
jgi:prevent-host-death family protein